jgi:hypothetical protein
MAANQASAMLILNIPKMMNNVQRNNYAMDRPLS